MRPHYNRHRRPEQGGAGEYIDIACCMCTGKTPAIAWDVLLAANMPFLANLAVLHRSVLFPEYFREARNRVDDLYIECVYRAERFLGGSCVLD